MKGSIVLWKRYFSRTIQSNFINKWIRSINEKIFLFQVNRIDWKSWWEDGACDLHGRGGQNRLFISSPPFLHSYALREVPMQVVTQFKIADSKKFDKTISTEDQLAALGWVWVVRCRKIFYFSQIKHIMLLGRWSGARWCRAPSSGVGRRASPWTWTPSWWEPIISPEHPHGEDF